MKRLVATGVVFLALLLCGVRSAAADRTPISERSFPDLLESLEHPNPFVRVEVVDELGRRKDARALLPLLGALRDEEAEVRAHAAEALRVFGDERAVPFLSRALEDRSELVRCRAVLALGDLAGKYVLPTLTRMLKDPSVVVRAAAIRALGEIGDPLSLSEVLEAVGTPGEDLDFAVPAAAVVASAKIGGVKGLAAALALVEEHLPVSWFLRATVAHAVGLAGDRARVELLVTYLESDEHPRVCQAAAGSLAALGETEALLSALELEGASRRQAAVGGLGSVTGEKARSALIRATTDVSPGVRLSAAAVLIGRGEKEVIPVLISLLESEAQVWLGALEILEMRTGLDFGRNPPRWREWFKESRERLVFDPETGLFGVK